jgi:hypothetical protein
MIGLLQCTHLVVIAAYSIYNTNRHWHGHDLIDSSPQNIPSVFVFASLCLSPLFYQVPFPADDYLCPWTLVSLMVDYVEAAL